MEIFLEILKYSAPLILALIMVYLVIDQFLKNEEKRRNFLIRKKDSSEIIRLKLQAFERMILFLERIELEGLYARLKNSSRTDDLLRFAMVKTIQAEFDHNLSQQIYLSEEAWHFIKTAKDKSISMVHGAFSKAEQDKISLMEGIKEVKSELEAQPQDIAISFLKTEIKKYLG